MATVRSIRRCPLQRLAHLLRDSDEMERDLIELGLTYVREAVRLGQGASLFARAELAATCLVAIRAAERLHGAEEARAMLDRLERSVRSTGARRVVLPTLARRGVPRG